MFSWVQLLMTVVLCFAFEAWIVFTGGVVVAYTESKSMVSDLGNAVNSSAAAAFILPLFVPHFIAALSFPIAAVPALIELLLGKRLVKLNFWTTALISAGSTVYLLAAGPAIFIALTGTVALKILNHVSTDKENYLYSILDGVYHYSDNYVLWGGNIALLIGIVATTLSFITHMCYFPHKLMRRSNQPTEVNERRLLLDVSTAPN